MNCSHDPDRQSGSTPIGCEFLDDLQTLAYARLK